MTHHTDAEAILDVCLSMLNTKTPLTPTTLQNQLLDCSQTLSISQSKLTLAPKSYYDYIFMSNTLFRLSQLRASDPQGASWWTEERFNSLKQTGLLFLNCSHRLNKASSKDFLYLLQFLLEKLPLTKTQVESLFLGEYMKTESFTTAKVHDSLHVSIQKQIAKTFLISQGCHFVAQEIDLERKHNKEKHKRGLRIDLLGWSEHGHVYGVEVKTRISDFKNSAARLERYIQYCNILYVLTDKEEVYHAACRWRQRRLRRESVGVLLCDPKGCTLLKQDPPISRRDEVTPKMLYTIHHACITSLRRQLNSLCLQDDTTPEQAAQTIVGAFKSVFPIF